LPTAIMLPSPERPSSACASAPNSAPPSKPAYASATVAPRIFPTCSNVGLTSRCWREDAPRSRRHVGRSSSSSNSRISEPPGPSRSLPPKSQTTFTYHFGKGRGVRWHDKPRGLLWLCAFDDAHDRGYEHAERLQQSGTLYPDIEQHTRSSESTLLPWGTRADEDAHEWARALYGALETWEINAAQLSAGETVSYPSALYLELSKDKDEIWTLVIRRRLAYLHTGAEERERWLTNGEIHALFRHLAGQPDEDDYEFENHHTPKHSSSHRSTSSTAPFPASWLKQVCDQAAVGTQPPLVT